MSLNSPQSSLPAEDPSRLAALVASARKLTEAQWAAIEQLRLQKGILASEALLLSGLVSQALIDAARSTPASAGSINMGRAAAALKMAHQPMDTHCENIRALRTEIFMHHKAASNLLTVVSAERGEGRSTLAAELAIAFAQLKEPTLLVDADLRNPAQHLLFGVGLASGITALAQQQHPAMHAVEGIDQLAVVTAGTLVMHPQELLAGQAFAALIKTWSSRYQHIVIDTPPASSQSDALSLSSLSGATVLLARQHHTLLLPYQTLLRRLSSANITVLAAVLSAY